MKTKKAQFIIFTILVALVISPFLVKNAFATNIHEATSFHVLQVAQADDEDFLSDLLEDEDVDEEEFDEEFGDELDHADVITDVEDVETDELGHADVITDVKDVEDVETDEDGLIDQIDTLDEKAGSKNPVVTGDTILKDAFKDSSYYDMLCDPSECKSRETVELAKPLPPFICLKPGAIFDIINNTISIATIYFEPDGITNKSQLDLMPSQTGRVIAGQGPLHGKMTVILHGSHIPDGFIPKYATIVICPRQQ